MTAKNETYEPTNEEGFVHEEGGEGYAPDMDAGIQTDFDVESEYVPAPLITQGWYNASITEAKLDVEKQCISITYTLNDNGGVMTDGETPVDGNTITGNVWLPKPGDENEYTKTGRQTKRQAKINMMQDFTKKTKISLNKPVEILTALRNQDWLGLSMKVKISAREYQGRVFNQVDDVKSA